MKADKRRINSIKRLSNLESERQPEVMSQRLKSNNRDIGPTEQSLVHVAGGGKPFMPTLARREMNSLPRAQIMRM